MTEELKQAFDEGWRMAAEWANRDDLVPDMDSPQYAEERDDRLRTLTQRPAAQDDDGVLLPRRLAATQKLKQLGYHYDAAQGQWLPTQPAQQATPSARTWLPATSATDCQLTACDFCWNSSPRRREENND